MYFFKKCNSNDDFCRFGEKKRATKKACGRSEENLCKKEKEKNENMITISIQTSQKMASKG